MECRDLGADLLDAFMFKQPNSFRDHPGAEFDDNTARFGSMIGRCHGLCHRAPDLYFSISRNRDIFHLYVEELMLFVREVIADLLHGVVSEGLHIFFETLEIVFGNFSSFFGFL